MPYGTLLFEVDEAGIALVTINRPDKLNALNADVIDDLERAFGDARSRDDVKAVVVTGSGHKSFVAGADISAFRELDAQSGKQFSERGQAVFDLIEATPKPVIAAVNGFALGGGCELAMACHLRVAAEAASFGQPEVNLGILPGYGGTQRLPRLVGQGQALEMILTGERISARRAHEIGLVNRVAPDEEVVQTAKDLAASILSKAPVAVKLSIQAVLAHDGNQKNGLALERELFGQACSTDDFKEGVDAFLNRRSPSFKGR